MSRRSRVQMACLIAASAAGCARTDYWIDDRQDGDSVSQWHAVGQSASGGGVSNHGADAHCKRVAVRSDGTPFVLWVDESAGERQQNVYVRYWEGNRWAELGGSGSGAGISQVLEARSGKTCLGDIGFDASDLPLVVWQQALTIFDSSDPTPDEVASQAVYLRTWNGGDWVGLSGSELNDGVSIGGQAWFPSIATTNDRPVVVWSQASAILLRQLDPTWAGVDGSDATPGIGGNQSAAGMPDVGAFDTTYIVTWQGRPTSGDNSDNIYVMQWDGGGWSGLANPGEPDNISGISDNNMERPVLELDTKGSPIVAWGERLGGARANLHVARWAGTWQAVGDLSGVAADIEQASDGVEFDLAVAADDAVVLVWEQTDPVGLNIHGAVFRDGRWGNLDADGSEGGISRSAADSRWPAVAVAPDGTIYVAWEERIGAQISEVYLRYASRL